MRKSHVNGLTGVRTLALMGVILLLFTACGSSSAATTTSGGKTLTRVSLRLDWIASGEHTEFFVADQLGYFADEGLAVTILEGNGSGSVVKLISAKNNDFGIADFGALSKSVAEGVRAKAVLLIYRKNPGGILSLKSTGINGPKDLEGKTLGTAPAEGPFIIFPAYMKANSVDQSKVKIVNMDPAVKVAALCSKQVNSIIEFATAEGPVARGQCTEPVVEQLYANFGVTSISSGIVVNPDTIRDKPQVVKGFVKAVQRALAYDKANPDAAIKIVTDRFPQTVEPKSGLDQLKVNIAISEPPAGKPYGYYDPAEVKKSLDLLQQYGGLANPLAPDTYYTDQFVGS